MVLRAKKELNKKALTMCPYIKQKNDKQVNKALSYQGSKDVIIVPCTSAQYLSRLQEVLNLKHPSASLFPCHASFLHTHPLPRGPPQIFPHTRSVQEQWWEPLLRFSRASFPSPVGILPFLCKKHQGCSTSSVDVMAYEGSFSISGNSKSTA